MSDRFFPNEMPRFVEEGDEIVPDEASLSKLLSMPYPELAQRLKRAGLDLSQAVKLETWGISRRLRERDYSLYVGALGTAFLLFKSYQVNQNRDDLNLCSEIVNACDSASSSSRDVTFICGRAGVYSIGALAAKHMGDDQLVRHYITKFKEINLIKDLSDELLYGRAGFLYACLFLNKNIKEGVIPSSFIGTIVDEIIAHGRRLGNEKCPLMFEWYRKRYWGAAHGLAGIMHVLMHAKLKPDQADDVKRTLMYMIRHRFPSGNYPSSEENNNDALVHWCHGAPGVAITMVKAAEVFGDREFMEAAIDTAEVIWNRGLLNRVGICHGISGNTYVFLSLHRLTGKREYLYKAKAFASFLLERAHTLISKGKMHRGDNPYSLFEGLAGMAYLFLDMAEPNKARFPAYEL
ncbi:lanC-like protein GCL2 [Impatiens glandulifera]|uniref:lanC-like protein GCL2 n=1 Tax=Impatiens glandulifera TaxID=253017 RepID=UPI001FB0D656|nr:lanC-like protein GCL2 [Impatiens glandulifera]